MLPSPYKHLQAMHPMATSMNLFLTFGIEDVQTSTTKPCSKCRKRFDEFELLKSTTQPPDDTACRPCLAGQMKEYFNKEIDTHATAKIQWIHVGLYGIQTASSRGSRCFLLFTDDYSRTFCV